ncbi:MAG: NADH-quinone oxidoreductase subunit C [Proteobacteria bacterium]|nr:MAG: NADH-quinone oxidoreductase subunit C [Pseudomonadota bacterium]
MTQASNSDPQLRTASESLVNLLKTKIGAHLKSIQIELDHVVARIDRAQLLDVCRILKLDSELHFDFFVNITAVDWMDGAEERFEVVYHLMNSEKFYRLRVKAWLPEEDPKIESVSSLWNGANFMERETWDMYGIVFSNHPDLRRILMYDEFKGHPLRKDYPVQGKQPRIPLRYPEVSNTARDMIRPELIQIGRKVKPQAELRVFRDADTT